MRQRSSFREATERKPQVKFWIGLSLFGCVLTAAVYFVISNGRTALVARLLEPSGQNLPLATPPATTDGSSRFRPGTDTTSTPNPAPRVTTSTSAEINRQMSEKWLASVANYHEDDRARVLDELEDSLARRGPGVVFELKRGLDRLTPYRTTERAATFHALGRVGQTLLSSNDPDAASALAMIQRVAKEELALPDYLPPDPDLHTETMAPAELHSALHLGVIVKKDGKVLQPSMVSKVAAIQMLTAVSSADALKQLQALQQRPDNSVGIQLVVERAIALVSHK